MTLLTALDFFRHSPNHAKHKRHRLFQVIRVLYPFGTQAFTHLISLEPKDAQYSVKISFFAWTCGIDVWLALINRNVLKQNIIELRFVISSDSIFMR